MNKSRISTDREVVFLSDIEKQAIVHQNSNSARTSNAIIQYPSTLSLFNRYWIMWLPKTVKPLECYYNMTQLEPDEVRLHWRYMAHSGYAHKPVKKQIEAFGYQAIDPQSICANLSNLRGNIESLDGSSRDCTMGKCFVDRNTGLKILVSLNPAMKEIVLAFGDSNSLIPELKGESKAAHRQHIKAIAGNLVGLSPELYIQADVVSKQIMKIMQENAQYDDYNFVLAGQSLGGSLAQFVGLCNNIKSMCYNAVPLGKGLQSLIGDEKLRKADLYITHLAVASDFASDQRGSGTTSLFLNCLGICTPSNFGQRNRFPTAYTSPWDTHSFILGSSMGYLGRDLRKKPEHLKE